MFLRFLHFWPNFGQFLADRQQKHNSDERLSKKGSYQIWLRSAKNCRRSSVLRFSHFSPYFGQFLTDRQQKHNSEEEPSKEGSYQVWLRSAKKL